MKTDTSKGIKVKWRCPSNIAVVKYWGKKEEQIPCNASLSMTLKNAYTEVEAELSWKENDGKIAVNYFFEGSINEAFGARVKKFIESNLASFSFAKSNIITIRSTNSFPHSAGIASSASAFGAIALALLDIEYKLNKKEISADFYREASRLARLGSGSASRSIYSGFVEWGESSSLGASSDRFATQLENVHPVFQSFKDAILIVEDKPKKVSSSVGHSLMNDHPYAYKRFEQANKRVVDLISILNSGDTNAFVSLCESEALTLHAMMMTSKDYYLLLKPETITIIEKIIAYRIDNNIPVCFTLDAGPNIHMLYPEESSLLVEKFIQKELTDYCKDVLYDGVGEGPIKLEVG